MSDSDQESDNKGFFDSQGWKDANETCKDLSEEAGALTEAIYSAGGIGGTVAGQYLGQTVEENWKDVCDLPPNVYDSVTGGETEAVNYTPDSTLDENQ